MCDRHTVVAVAGGVVTRYKAIGYGNVGYALRRGEKAVTMRPLLAPPYPSPHIYIGVWPLAAAVLVATRRMAPAPARRAVVLLPRPLGALLLPVLGA